MEEFLGMEFIFKKVSEKVSWNGKRRVLLWGRRDEDAISALFTAREEEWVEVLALGSSFKGVGFEVVFPSVDIFEAGLKAVGLIREGEGDVLLYTGPLDRGFFSLLMEQVKGINKERIMSYVSVVNLPKRDGLTLMTDTLINVSPGLKEKIGIVENGIEFSRRLGIERPRIAALAPLELVNPSLCSTLDAAILSKMSERSQFGEAIVEGPLAMDNAVSISAARHKGIESSVPGNVDIYLFPDLESAHITLQFLVYLGGLESGGVLAGTPFPVVIRSPLERPSSWLINLSLGCLMSE
jgi:phosphate butyryltransferase